MTSEVNDEELMLRYRDGDAGAFEILYTRHKGGLYRYILRKCSNTAVAEELFQDVWLKLINARERYEVQARFTTYLYQMAHNRCIDYYRRQSIAVIDLLSTDDRDDIAGNVQDQPDCRAELQEQTELVMQLLEQLPSEQREAFVLREEGGLSIEAIAEVTGVNPETAKSRLRYAVNKLRAGLQNE